MAFSTRLDLRQTQSLVMTPQLQQAIKLLQMSSIELTEYVEQAIEQNPLLERLDGEGAGEGETAGEDPAEGTPEPHGEGVIAAPGEATLDVAYEDIWADASSTDAPQAPSSPFAFQGMAGGERGDGETSLEQTLSRPASLREHLLAQVHVDLIEPVERIIGVHLVDLVDESGYLAGELDAVARRLNCGIEVVEETLAKVQGFDPPGVFARNLKECLSLQLSDRGRLTRAFSILLDNLDLLAKRDADALCKVCGVGGDELSRMAAELRTLDPKPGLAFDTTVVQTIVPDVTVHPDRAGGWIVELNSDALPRVLINARYYAHVSRKARSKQDKAYIAECFQSANWLVKSLHQRATTILKVSTEIVQQQRAFLANGVGHMRPLVLRDIAAAINMHESTVSRVTTNKYMTTPRGLYELKYFFTPAIASAAGGEAHSAEAVRFRIRRLLDAESIDDVLSDDKIVDILRKDGIDIARRTVAKYRKSMRISSSAERRRDKLGGRLGEASQNGARRPRDPGPGY